MSNLLKENISIYEKFIENIIIKYSKWTRILPKLGWEGKKEINGKKTFLNILN